ncbi:MAG TPA: glycosyltransferase [Steroidobacteraceae bacterium]|nr:glycosyltransferase [Steroidobacteraceae bacterium]
MRILTNFMNSPESVESPSGSQATVLKRESWAEIRRLLDSVDLVIIDCRDTLIYKLAAYLLLRPWRKMPLIAVDVVLRQPLGLRHKLSAGLKRLLFARVDHFIHYFKDVSGYTRYFGITAARSSYVPFKVNINDVPLTPREISEDYVFTMGVSLRDYDTFIRAISALPYPAAIPEFSFENFEGRDRSWKWTKDTIPQNLTILPDSGVRADLIRNLARARLVVIPTQASSLCASGISTYLAAMHLGKCVISSTGPGASDLLTDQALLVAPHDVTALKHAITRAWEDDVLRQQTAENGRRYAASLGGEPELLQRIYRRALEVVAVDR